MLKNHNPSYKDEFSGSSLRMPMSDEAVERYIQVFFSRSPRMYSGTAPASEWLEFLELFNEHENYYMLTELQKRAIKPYCEMNQDLAMTPEEFISLVYLIRHGQQQFDMPITPHISESTPILRPSSIRDRNLMDSQPRSSKALNSNRSFSYYDDISSVNHPEPLSNSSFNERGSRSDYVEEQDNEYEIRLKNKEIISLKNQLREYDARMSNLSKEQSERTSQFQASIENLKTEIDQQRQVIAELKHKEKDRLEKITELTTVIHNLQATNDISLKKIQKKDEENENLRESLEEIKTITNANLEMTESELSQLRDIIRVHEREKAELHMKIEQEKMQVDDLQQEIEAQRHENTRLLEIVDRQKFDLDEARSGSIYTPINTIEKKISSSEQDQDTSLAQDQIEAEYLKNLELLKDERDQAIESLNNAKAELLKAGENIAKREKTQQAQNQEIEQLSLKFDQQVKLVDEIQSRLTPRKKSTTWYTSLSIIPWLFLFFHIYLILLGFFIPSDYPFQPFYILEYIDEWLYKYSS